MINHWIITSALADSGCFSQEDKFHQTVLTINSIRKYSPNNHIILVEGSNQEITGIHRRTLVSMVDWYMDCHNLSEFKKLHNTEGRERQNLKSSLECFLVMEALRTKVAHWVQPSHRVYKISGRYKLNQHYNFQTHVNQQHKWCFARMHAGIFMDYQRLGQYPTRMYSFCGSLINQAQQTINDIKTKLETDYEKGSWLDIEHAMFDHLSPQMVHQVSPLGVEGLLSNCGTLVSD